MLPTYITDVNMSIVTESLDADIWKEMEERGRVWRVKVSAVCSLL